MTGIKSVSIVAHDGKPRAIEMRDELAKWLSQRDIDVVDGAADLVLALGGDGTVLRAAQVAHAADAPLLGVNLGSLGYLTEVEDGKEKDALEAVLSGSFQIEERMMLSCTASNVTERYVGLNEVLVERASRHRLVRLLVRIGGEGLAAFNADGIIVSTPTGSTAYSLSAGGPIVSPRAESLIVVPVSPHMIFARPFVLAPDQVVEIVVDSESRDRASLVVDGNLGCEIGPGDSVSVARHPQPLHLIRLEGPGFVERLRVKLGLPG